MKKKRPEPIKFTKKNLGNFLEKYAEKNEVINLNKINFLLHPTDIAIPKYEPSSTKYLGIEVIESKGVQPGQAELHYKGTLIQVFDL